MNTDYDDIIHLPHHVSRTRPQMSMADRAAQFSPFAALTGHEAAIEEAARITDERPILDEAAKWQISDRLQYAAAHPRAQLHLTYFIPDSRKSGGSFAHTSGSVSKLIPHTRQLILHNHPPILIDDIVEVFLEADEETTEAPRPGEKGPDSSVAPR